MKSHKIHSYLSTPRFSRYLDATDNNEKKAIQLYKANMKIAQAFHPMLGIFEVALRNRINDILADYFSDKDWIINQKKGFMADSSLKYIDRLTGKQRTKDFLKRSVEKAERRIKLTNTHVTSGKIIADQTLGFWTDLFELHHFRILRGKPIQIFSDLPNGYGRKEISSHLNHIRVFRNRIHHNEPICFDRHIADFAYAESVHKAITDVLKWIDPELLKWSGSLNTVRIKIESARKIKIPDLDKIGDVC